MSIISDGKNVKEFLSKIQEISQTVLCRYTVPLLQFTRKEGYTSLGSGIFINAEDEFFLLTAGHVIEEKNNIFFPSSSGIIPLDGRRVSEPKINKDIALDLLR